MLGGGLQRGVGGRGERGGGAGLAVHCRGYGGGCIKILRVRCMKGQGVILGF